ncbi:GNAT family N-acetyltransferase [Oscillatoriales cyanobacterium LEGE 11467]|uniref:GNAT family N-acetyltransferase n=1 Tax=Zarconia navalis LEGE 11467 TaxID=1828826 RepID=A0A928VX24_9CYAN|nr:GNAT family N-acetyltransferase [Zarconia navalis]MBE9040863.1 GNAT family N-acetyltransferase [Zarconia navalis LEGE 11467]
MNISLPLRTQRLVVRKFQPSDLPAYLEFMLDGESTQYLAFDDAQKTESGATELFNYVVSAYDSENPVHAYAIALAETDRYVGSCGFSPYEDDVVECYYSINPGDRRQGYAIEAMQGLLEALVASGIGEVRAYASAQNIPSLKLAQKLGMTNRGPVVHAHSGLEGILYSMVFPPQSKSTLQ